MALGARRGEPYESPSVNLNIPSRGIVYRAPYSYQIIDANDILIIEADPEDPGAFVENTGIVLVTTMLLSAVINNAVAVILMAPIGIKVAKNLGSSFDPFLTAVAIGGP